MSKAKNTLPAVNRKAMQRERDKALGQVRVEMRLDRDEVDQLDKLCAALRPGAEPYSRPELVGLLVRQQWKTFESQLAEVSRCKKCGEPAPVTECVLSKDSECWRYYAPPTFTVKI